MMVKGYQKKFKCVQIPVVYKERIGMSSVTGSFGKAFSLGIKMIMLIFILRFKLDTVLLKHLR